MGGSVVTRGPLGATDWQTPPAAARQGALKQTGPRTSGLAGGRVNVLRYSLVYKEAVSTR